MQNKIDQTLSEMSLWEKAQMCSCKSMALTNKEVKHLGIPPLTAIDGPYGVRKMAKEGDNLGISQSKPSTCYPTTSCLACSFDKELLFQVGEHLGEEALTEGVSILLGPGMNIKRSPICGRNFEYFSEDPCVSGSLAAAYVKGLQSKGVGSCIKHFALNNQEFNRMMNESVVDDRALREIYLRGFEYVVKNAKPYEIMNSYNWFKGEAVSQCKFLLNDVLREEWGFEGVVVSDFGSSDDRVKGLIAGQDIECPSSADKLIYKELKNGTLDEKYVDRAVRRQLALVIKCFENLKKGHRYNIEKHHAFAAYAASQSIVLLKNDGNILPFPKKGKIAVIGEFAKKPRYQGCGSAIVNPNILTSLVDALDEEGIEYIYAPGYSQDAPPDERLIAEAVTAAEGAERVILLIGLPDSFESEAVDRRHMKLPESHYALAEGVMAANKNVAFVVCAGAPVEMSFVEKAKGLLYAYLGGEGVGTAIRDIVFGRVNPSGKLAETLPKHLEDNPSYNNFANGTRSTQYRESLYVGYRYYEAANVKPEFEFGFGLSYTKFDYSYAKLLNGDLNKGNIKVSVNVKNSGKMDGAEVIELYVRNATAAIYRPKQEMRAFEKVFLKKGEEKEIILELCRNDFEYWNPKESRWVLEGGEYYLQISASLSDTRAVLQVRIEGETIERPVEELFYDHVTGNDFPLEDFEKILGRNVPPLNRPGSHPYDMNSSMKEVKRTKFGAKLYKLVMGMVTGKADTVEGNSHLTHIEIMIDETPFRNLVQVSDGIFSYRMAKGILKYLNKQRFTGICIMISSFPAAIVNYIRSN